MKKKSEQTTSIGPLVIGTQNAAVQADVQWATEPFAFNNAAIALPHAIWMVKLSTERREATLCVTTCSFADKASAQACKTDNHKKRKHDIATMSR